jgi:hypothetical protein
MPTSAECAIEIIPVTRRRQRIQDLMVKYWLVGKTITGAAGDGTPTIA